MQLFQIKYKLEELISKVWNSFAVNADLNDNRIISPTRMINDLSNNNVINPDIVKITKGILSICNSAVHGKITTERQREFVFNNSRFIYDALMDIIREEE